VLLYDPARIEPRDWLTKHLGEVLLLDPETDDVEASAPGEPVAPAAPDFVEHQIRDGTGWLHKPVRAELMRCDFGLPTRAEVWQYMPAGLRPVEFETVPEFKVTLPSGRSLWLASISGTRREEGVQAKKRWSGSSAAGLAWGLSR